MPKKQIIILVIFVLVIAAGIIYVLPRRNDINIYNDSSVPVNSKVIECDRDSDCLIGGCSNTLCLPRDKASGAVGTCEWRDEYACFAKDACGCVDHQCQWANNELYLDCMNKLL